MITEAEVEPAAFTASSTLRLVSKRSAPAMRSMPQPSEASSDSTADDTAAVPPTIWTWETPRLVMRSLAWEDKEPGEVRITGQLWAPARALAASASAKPSPEATIAQSLEEKADLTAAAIVS